MPEVKDPYEGKHGYGCESVIFKRGKCDCSNYYTPWKEAAKRVIDLERALNLCGAQAGAPSAIDGCHRIIKTVKDVLPNGFNRAMEQQPRNEFPTKKGFA